MKRAGIYILLLFPLFLLGGCFLPSVYSLYDGATDEKLVMVPEIAGTWKHPDTKDTWAFETGDGMQTEKYYKLTCKQKKRNKAVFAAHFVRLNGDLFMDIFTIADENKTGSRNMLMENDMLRFSLYAVHNFAKVNVNGNKMQILQFFPTEPDSVNKYSLEKLNFIRADGGTILVSKPEEIRRFLSAHSNDKTCFTDTIQLTKE
ncbi:MAG: hypothetical protein V4543_01165 [Bacteroidota bacterium]